MSILIISFSISVMVFAAFRTERHLKYQWRSLLDARFFHNEYKNGRPAWGTLHVPGDEQYGVSTTRPSIVPDADGANQKSFTLNNYLSIDSNDYVSQEAIVKEFFDNEIYAKYLDSGVAEESEDNMGELRKGLSVSVCWEIA